RRRRKRGRPVAARGAPRPDRRAASWALRRWPSPKRRSLHPLQRRPPMAAPGRSASRTRSEGRGGGGPCNHLLVAIAGAIIHTTCLLAALVAADGGAPSNERAKSSSQRAEVEAALAKGGSPGELQRWAATAEGTLMVVAGDRAASETVRGRALAALAFARTARARGFLEYFVIETLLDSADVEVRLDAAAALGLTRLGDAEKPLRARLAVETDPGVKRQIGAALKAVTAAR